MGRTTISAWCAQALTSGSKIDNGAGGSRATLMGSPKGLMSRRASQSIAFHDGVLFVHVLQPASHYELEQVSKAEIEAPLRHQADP